MAQAQFRGSQSAALVEQATAVVMREAGLARRELGVILLDYLLKWLLRLAIICSSTALAEPQVREEIHYYSVVAESLDTLLLALSSAVPDRPGGKIFHGYTHSKVSWRWKFARKAGRCRMYHVESEVHNQITLPELVSRSPDSEAASIWKQWYPALLRHERQHANNAVQLARRGETRLLTLPPTASCETLDLRASQMVDELIAQLGEINDAYDKRTNHGESEGAALLSYKKARNNK